MKEQRNTRAKEGSDGLKQSLSISLIQQKKKEQERVMFSHCWLAKISSFTTILFLPLLKETGGENMMKKHLMG